MAKFAIIINPSDRDHQLRNVNDSLQNYFEDRRENYQTYVASTQQPTARHDHYYSATPQGIESLIADVRSKMTARDQLVIYSTSSVKLGQNQTTLYLDKDRQARVSLNNLLAGLPARRKQVVMVHCNTNDPSVNPFCQKTRPNLWAPANQIPDTNRDGRISWNERYSHAVNDHAVRFDRVITKIDQDVEVLVENAETLRLFQSPDKAAPLFGKLIQKAKEIKKPDHHYRALGAIAVNLGEAGLGEKAAPLYDRLANAATTVTLDEYRTPYLPYLVGLMADGVVEAKLGAQTASAFGRLIDVAETLVNESARAEAFGSIAKNIARSDLQAEKLPLFDRLIGLVEEEDSRGGIAPVALYLAQANLGQQAASRLHRLYKASEAIEHLGFRVGTWGNLAIGFADIGERQKSRSIFDRAYRFLVTIKDSAGRCQAQSQLTLDFARAGFRREASAAFEKIIRAAQKITNPQERAKTLGLIAFNLFEAEFHQRSTEVFTQASAIAKNIKSPFERCSVLRSIATRVIETGNNELAIDLFKQSFLAAKKIKDTSLRSTSLGALATTLRTMDGEGKLDPSLKGLIAKAEDGMDPASRRYYDLRLNLWLKPTEVKADVSGISGRIDTIAQNKDGFSSYRQIQYLGKDLSQGHWEGKSAPLYGRLVKIARSLKNPRYRVSALTSLAQSLAAAGLNQKQPLFFEQAISAAETVINSSSSSEVVTSIAESLAKAKTKRGAKLFDRLISVSKRIQDPHQRFLAYAAIANHLPKAKLGRKAEPLLGRLVSVSYEMELGHYRARSIGRVALYFARVGLQARASEFFEQAIQIAKAVSDPFERSDALGSIAASLVEARRKDQAIALLDHAIAASEKRGQHTIPSFGVYCNTIANFSNAGFKEEMDSFFDQAADQARDQKSLHNKAIAYSTLAKSFAKAGYEEKAKRYFEQALETAEKIQMGYSQLGTLGTIAHDLRSLGLNHKTTDLSKRCLKAAEKITDPTRRFQVLVKVAENLLSSELYPKVAPLYEDLIQAAEKLDSPRRHSDILVMIALQFPATTSQERAVRLFEQLIESGDKIEDVVIHRDTRQSIIKAVKLAGLEEEVAIPAS